MIEQYNHYDFVLKAAEEKVPQILNHQVLVNESFDYGGIESPETGFANPGEAASALVILIPLYLNKDSRYFQKYKLQTAIELLLAYLKRVQRPDGTFDLLTTNFYSAPDTGFMIHNLALVYKIIVNYKENSSINWKNQLLKIIKNAGSGMVNGGFHTPNHRWVIAAALMMTYNIVGIEEYKDTAERYLAEGIDCDANGEYAERSAGIYNATNDDALIKLTEETGNNEFLEYVRRNLDLMFNYLEPDGSVFTQNSTRQDSGQFKKFYPARYYHTYLYMGMVDNNDRYLTMASHIIENSDKWQYNLGDNLYLFMLKPEFKDVRLTKKSSLPINYERFFERSGVVRTRRGKMSFTLLKNNSSFLYFQVGELICYLKICASFFARAQFKAQELKKTATGYQLSFQTQGSYRLPFADAPEISDWWQMNHEQRETGVVVDLKMIVQVKEIDKGLNIKVKTEGCDRVPLKLEFCFTPGCRIMGEGFSVYGKPGQSLTATSGFINIKKGTDIMKLGPAFGKHTYTDNMRGSEPVSNHGFTIYFTDFTNIERDLSLLMS